MKNRKGFTIVELLTVVVILGVLSTLAVAGVGGVIRNSHKKYNESQVKLLIAAAQTYYTDHKSLLPTMTFTKKKVTLQTLIDNNYIEPLVDYKKEPYDTQKSYAYVTRMAVGKYEYDGELIQTNGSSTKYKENVNSNGKISITNDEHESLISNEIYTNNEKRILVEMEDPDTIAGYIITLYRGNKNIEDLEYKEVGNQTKVSTTIKLSKDKYPDGVYKLKVKLIDIYNNQKTVTTKNITIDTIAPSCRITLKGTKKDNDWYIEPVDLTMKVSNESGETVSCIDLSDNCYSAFNTNKSYSKTVTKTNNDNGANITYYGQTVDKAGNSGKCNITFKQDTVEPTIYLKKYTLDRPSKEIKDEMINEPFRIKIGFSVGPSGIKHVVDTDTLQELLASADYEGSYYIGDEIRDNVYKIKTYQITDNAGRTAKSSITVHKETEKPTITFSNGKDKNNITITCTHPRIVGNTRLVFDNIDLWYRKVNEQNQIRVNYVKDIDNIGNIKYTFSAPENSVVVFSGVCSLQTRTGWTSSAYKNTDWAVSHSYYCYKTNHSDPVANPNYVNCLTANNCANANKTCCRVFYKEFGITNNEYCNKNG